jgi:hypothetical protein
MSSYQTEQHRLLHRGRWFHFVSYEGRPADPKLELADLAPGWFLMYAGRRWWVSPQGTETAAAALDRQFAEWLDAHVFCDAVALQSQQPAWVGPAGPAGPAVDPRSTRTRAGAGIHGR